MTETSAALDALAAALGIEPTFTDAFGHQTQVSAQTKRALIAAMGYDAGSDEAARASFERFWRAPWIRILEPVVFAYEGADATAACTLHSAKPELALAWTLTLEDGSRRTGTTRWGDTPLLERRIIERKGYERRGIALPEDLPLGYHQLAVQAGEAAGETTVIVCPEQAYLPPALEHAPGWGMALQLYALRRSGDWGIGDFTALAELAQTVVQRGGAAVALNPLHRLHLHNPDAISPYGPTSRFALDPLYIDPLTVAEFAESRPAQQLARDIDIARRRKELSEEPLIEYPAVSALKRLLFEELYRTFCSRHMTRDGGAVSARGEAFLQFRREGGIAIERLGAYECLAEYHRARDPQVYGWLQWPPEHRDPKSPFVAEFVRRHRERVAFFIYLAWIADEQLAVCARACTAMPIGLYRDLAVGADSNSAEAWSSQEIMRAQISVGAPPDPLNTEGQSWGLPAVDPHALRAAAYQPFAQLLRANMRYAGALRIDHVMALTRLFWIPVGRPASEGGYVRYPLDEMLGVLALESTRAKCLIVGEDLGTVPAGFRERLNRARLFSTRLLFFEREPGGGFVDALAYPRYAVASVATHDLPPLAGWWTGRDIDVREGIGFVTPPAAAQEREARKAERLALVERLRLSGVLEATDVAAFHDAALTGIVPADGRLNEAVCVFLGRAPSLLVLVALDDVLSETEQVNVPGTVAQHPNWRLRSRLPVEILREYSPLARLAARLSKTREEVRV
ncbi:MAG TPA: 4-alpha-glucanotransferase [Candidatus Acidoferrales bacterium]|nr:4-alpha-glucanotransferase [Candidatus Acidoferrales bacterium]